MSRTRILGPRLLQPPTQPSTIDGTSSVAKFAGKTVVFTGKLETMTRDEAAAQAKKLGATVGRAITKDTDILVAGSGAGSKLKDAKKHGVKVIDEAAWWKMATGKDVKEGGANRVAIIGKSQREKTEKSSKRKNTKAIEFVFMAKNCSFDISAVRIDKKRLHEQVRVNLFSPNCEEAESFFYEEFEKLAEKVDLTIKHMDDEGLVLDVTAIWRIEQGLLKMNKPDLIKVREASETWNDMSSIYLEVHGNIIDTATIEESVITVG